MGRKRGVAVAVASVGALLVSAGTLGGAANGSGKASTDEGPRLIAVHPKIVVKGLDNPRQLSRTGGKLVLGLAGRGGKTAKLGVIRHRHIRYVMKGYLSFADSDGSFAVGLNGASKRTGGPYFGLAVPKKAPPGQRRDGWLLSKRPGGKVHKLANLGKFERQHDPDGEGVESNPYSV